MTSSAAEHVGFTGSVLQVPTLSLFRLTIRATIAAMRSGLPLQQFVEATLCL